MTTERLRILHLEDDLDDRALVAQTLRQEGLACEIVAVDSREGFTAALRSGQIDLILSDDCLPAFDGRTAQKIAADLAPAVPFIVVVSGSLGEEVAIQRMKAGATDYVLKHRLSLLSSAISRARREARVRTEQARAEAEILRLNAELEQRVLDRTAELASATKALRQSEERLKGILEYSPATICLKDLDGRYLLVNPQAERTFGLDRAAIIGKTDHDLFAPRLADSYRANDQRVVTTGKGLHVEEPALIGGEIRIFSVSKFPLIGSDRQPYAVCSISSDITERKIAHDDLKAARLEAERANRAKSEFLSRMSHDLRTPLNAVLGFAQLLAVDELSAEQSECVQQILRGGEHLLDLINEVLDIARIEAGHLSLSPEPVAVRDVVQQAADLITPLALQRTITVAVEDSSDAGEFVLADRQRLSQILLNLLSNAVKYNRAGGRVTVSFESHRPRKLKIKVADTGVGIPPEKLPLLFTPFERLGAEGTAVQGTGLGLALSRGLAEAMGGSVGVSSEVDQGSTFWVELALTGESPLACLAPAPNEGPWPSEARRAATVLYIEDNLSNVRLMERVLARRPEVKLLHAGTGHAGVALAREAQPSVIFLDMHLPDTSGDEVFGQLWADPALRHIPVIVLSADVTSGHARRMTAFGATAYLTKPLDVKKVLMLLDRTLTGADGDLPRQDVPARPGRAS
jgi:PAS domain S-box-containing protein